LLCLEDDIICFISVCIVFHSKNCVACPMLGHVRGLFEKFVDWRQCAAVMQREAVTVRRSCSGGGNVYNYNSNYELWLF
jgi:hypothetical protein